MSPVYLFKCDCGHEFEELRAVDLRECAICPKCGKTATRKFTPIPFSFGWTLSDASHERFHKDEFVKNV